MARKRKSVNYAEGSDNEVKNGSVDSNNEEEDYGEDEDVEDEIVPMSNKKHKKKNSLQNEDEEEEGEFEEPDYISTSLQPPSLKFLADVAANNNRDWFHLHKKEYTDSRKDYESFVMSIYEILMGYDPDLPKLNANDVCFRLHRDIRFSNDKTPYKTHYATVFSRTGKKGPYAGYYMILRPNSCSIGAGYFPFGDRDTTQRKFETLRNEISDDSSRFKSRLTKIQRNSGDKVFNTPSDNSEGVVNEFIEQNQEYSLKRCPNGYDKQHPDVKLLMLKSLTITRNVELETLYKLNGAEVVGKMFAELTPWVHYLNRRLVTTQ